MNFTYNLNEINKTNKLAKTIAKIATKNMVILLDGELGVGKTQLTKFIGQELKIVEIINSPTFVTLNIYETAQKWKLIHIDAYRLNNKTNFFEYIEYIIDNFTVIEWAKNFNFNFKDFKIIKIAISNINSREALIETKNLNATENNLFRKISKIS